ASTMALLRVIAAVCVELLPIDSVVSGRLRLTVAACAEVLAMDSDTAPSLWIVEVCAEVEEMPSTVARLRLIVPVCTEVLLIASLIAFDEPDDANSHAPISVIVPCGRVVPTMSLAGPLAVDPPSFNAEPEGMRISQPVPDPEV